MKRTAFERELKANAGQLAMPHVFARLALHFQYALKIENPQSMITDDKNLY